jgi:hypothetical protein
MEAPMATKTLPEQAYLLECLVYEADTGRLIWAERPVEHFQSGKRYARERTARAWNQRLAGKDFGAVIKYNRSKTTYLRGRLDCASYLAHRLIWKMKTDEEPPEVDHRDGDGSNNRWTNLRNATHSNNMQNRPDNGSKGATRSGRNWRSAIRVNGHRIHLGSYPTQAEAAQAYRDAADLHHGEFATHRSRH